MRAVEVRGEFITLGQLLKVAGIVGSGGEGKLFLKETSIRVNGLHDNRRGRKLRPGDVVAVEGHEEIRLVSEGEEESG